jgi:hypothetical protein
MPALSVATFPAGTQLLNFENLEGLVLFPARLSGVSRDTAGLLLLDTGAGFLALDQPLARALGVADETAAPSGIDLAPRALPRMELGSAQIDQVTPLLTIDAEIIRRVTDRAVLGLLGHRPLVGRAVIVDYREQQMALIPLAQDRPRSVSASRRELAAYFSPRARSIPFDLQGDGKILLRGHVSDPEPGSSSAQLTWIVDTGATRCVLFEDALEGAVRHHGAWSAMEGLIAPTLFGDEAARVARVPRWTVLAPDGPIEERDIETVLIGGPLHRALSMVVGEPVHGLIGYSFLSRYRIGIDYVNETLWLDPLPEGWEGRPYRDSQIGLQIERVGRAMRVAGVVRGSPADEAGVRLGDELTLLDGVPAAALDIKRAILRMEGRPGTSITMTLQRGTRLMPFKLLRRRLLP